MNHIYYYKDGTTSNERERDPSKTLHREDGPAVERANGHKEWWLNGRLHREDGPAIEGEGLNGSKQEWYINGVLHREDGPAAKYANGNKRWLLNGQFHREDGPAVEDANGSRTWYINGTLHREDGPAIIHQDGSETWCINNKLLTTLTKEYLTKYMELNNLTITHLLTDSDEIVRTSATKCDWKD
jgi:hypothetical protein